MASNEMINIILLGRTNYGKSTICGRLVSEYGIMDKKEIDRAKKHSEILNRKDMEYAFIMDKSLEERQRRITIQIGYVGIEINNKRINLMDPPGHIEFINNLISGVAGSDAAALIIDIKEFEKIGLDSQIEEHIRISKVFGIEQMIVLMNKMDLINYNEKKYLKIKEDIIKILKNAGYEGASQFKFIPVSGFYGDNISKKSKNMLWYHGQTFIEVLNDFKEPIRLKDKSLRMPVLRLFSLPETGDVITGRIERGYLKIGDNISISPSYSDIKMTARVKSIEWQHRKVDEAWHGMDIGIALEDKSATFTKRQIKKGYIVTSLDSELKPINKFNAEIIILNHPTSIKAGYKPVIYCHQARVPCQITKIINKINKNGKIISSGNNSLKVDERALVEIIPLKPFVAEEEIKTPRLGRFILRDANITVAAGKIINVDTN